MAAHARRSPRCLSWRGAAAPSAARAFAPSTPPSAGWRRGQRSAARCAGGREMAGAQELGITLIGWDEPEYPARLREIDDAPPLLALRGNRAALERPLLARGGTRTAPAAGRRFAPG